MKRALIQVALSTVLACCIGSPVALAKRHSPAHKAAVQRCKEEYKAAERQAMLFRGRERKIRMAEAKRALRQCKAAAPK
jgi:hypothetical protein